jgi:hypothetical protein
MNTYEIEDRIRTSAKNTDSLISRLDTLTNRIDTARVNNNPELVEYYERQFAETSAEFMGGVEAILDDWYAMKGESRPPASNELLEPETLDEIHKMVVDIIQGVPVASPITANRPTLDVESAPDMASASYREREAAAPVRAPRRGPGNKVDLTG